jgi:hypothetical protein
MLPEKSVATGTRRYGWVSVLTTAQNVVTRSQGLRPGRNGATMVRMVAMPLPFWTWQPGRHG